MWSLWLSNKDMPCIHDEPLLSSVTVSDIIGNESSSPANKTLAVGSKRNNVSADTPLNCCCWAKSEFNRYD